VTLTGARYDSTELWRKHSFRKVLNNKEEAEGEGETDENIYCLGSFCFVRTKLFHKLHHYKFHLMESCRKKIEELGHSHLLENAESDNDKKKTECLESLLDDHEWVSELTYRFNKLIDTATSFNATEEKQLLEYDDED